jgi:hypothetical protein
VLVLERVRVLVGDDDLVAGTERVLVVRDDVEALGIWPVVRRYLLAVKLHQQLVDVGVIRQEAQSLVEVLLREPRLFRYLAELKLYQLIGELLAGDELIGHVSQRIQLADRRHLGDDGVDLSGDGWIDRRRGRRGRRRSGRCAWSQRDLGRGLGSRAFVLSRHRRAGRLAA